MHHGLCDGCDQDCDVRPYRITLANTGAVELVTYCRECVIMARDPEWSPEILACVEREA